MIVVFSAIVVVVFCRVTAVGASLTSLTLMVKLVVRSGVVPTVVSSTLTVTL